MNSVLARKYTTSTPVKITRDMMWDMELQKAWDPTTFIPYVVSEGKSWGRRKSHDGSEHFFRSSEQLGWIATGRGTVLEEVFVDHVSQRILFLGRESMRDDSKILKASGLVDVFAATLPTLKLSPGVHVNYAETVLPIRDGLPKF